jgi:predicted ATPase
MLITEYLITKVLDPIIQRATVAARRLLRSRNLSYPTSTYDGSNELALLANYLEGLLVLACDRQRELQRVLALVAEGAGGIVLVEGRSGYGKTTFIAQLRKRLEQQEQRHIWHLFSRSIHPDSAADPLRFDANVAEQLAWFLGRDLGKISNLRNFIAGNLMDLQDPLTLLIDALDETDPSFLKAVLPAEVKPGLLILVTSRILGDDRALRLAGISRRRLTDSIELGPLSEEDLMPFLAERHLPSELTRDLLQITKGDPFYVRFVLEDLVNSGAEVWRARRAVEPAGLEEYLDSQFAQLSEIVATSPQLAQIATQIVNSPIPVPRSELINMIDGLTTLNFERHFQPIHRFFIATDQGFIVCHDRFQRYFLDRMAGRY